MKKDYKKKKKTGVSKPQVSFAKMPKATISTFGKKPDLERDIINLTGVALLSKLLKFFELKNFNNCIIIKKMYVNKNIQYL